MCTTPMDGGISGSPRLNNEPGTYTCLLPRVSQEQHVRGLREMLLADDKVWLSFWFTLPVSPAAVPCLFLKSFAQDPR